MAAEKADVKEVDEDKHWSHYVMMRTPDGHFPMFAKAYAEKPTESTKKQAAAAAAEQAAKEGNVVWFEKWYEPNEVLGAAMSHPLKVLSFNLLAPAWAKPEWFPQIDPAKLIPTVRLPLNLNAILHSAPDIVCLQEVDAVNYKFLHRKLQDAGYYVSKLSENKSNVVNGCAVAIRNASVAEHAVKNMLFGDNGFNVITVPGYPALINVHFDRKDLDEKAFTAQFKALIEYVKKEPNSIAIGDWNIAVDKFKSETKVLSDGVVPQVHATQSLCLSPAAPAMLLDYAVSFHDGPKVGAMPCQYGNNFCTNLVILKPTDALNSVLDKCGSDHSPALICLAPLY